MTGFLCCHMISVKNFQENQLNSSRFPLFPGGIKNSRRFPVFQEVVDTLLLNTLLRQVDSENTEVVQEAYVQSANSSYSTRATPGFSSRTRKASLSF